MPKGDNLSHTPFPPLLFLQTGLFKLISQGKYPLSSIVQIKIIAIL